MTIDERAKEPEWAATNVQRLIPRRSPSPPNSEQRSDSLAKRTVVLDSDDDPGPSAA
jgi:hypothetical protein